MDTMIEYAGVTLNRETLRLMDAMDDGRVYRTSGGKDVKRGRTFNQPQGKKPQQLGDAGLAQRDDAGTWSLTELGKQKKAEAAKAYEGRSVTPPEAAS